MSQSKQSLWLQHDELGVMRESEREGQRAGTGGVFALRRTGERKGQQRPPKSQERVCVLGFLS